MKKIIIGTRGSKLSLSYATEVRRLILKKTTDIDIEIRKVKTSGDINHNVKISEIGGKNLFCKEIEENLLDENIDIAVHALKDMESKENEKLMIAAYVKRNDPRDILISNTIKKISDLTDGIKIGSSSRRRELQLKKINTNLTIEYLRGNIDTRIKKLEEKNFDAIILAAAGIKHLKLENKIGLIFTTEEILPAVGQGIIAVQCRKNDNYIINKLKDINDRNTSLCASAEREMLKTLGGSCETALGGLAEINKNNLKLKAQLFSDDGKESFNYELDGLDSEALNIGKTVGKKLLSLAGNKFKKQ